MTRPRSDPVRVLQVINSSEEGGGARHLRSLVSGLQPAGFLPVVATTDHGPLVSWLERAQVRTVDVHMMGRRGDLRPVLRLRRLLAREPFDLLHLHGTRAGFFGVLALSTLAHRPRVVYTVHGLSCSREASSPVKRFYAGVERFIAKRAERIISVSETDRLSGVEAGILPPGRTCSIPNGVVLHDETAPGLPCRDGSPPRVVTVARLVRQKGIGVLLEAARRVAESRPEVTFTIFGDGPERTALEARSRHLGLGRTVRFAGTVDGVSRLLGEYDLFVLPSLWEGMPISLLEAMAAARPVVATAVSGSRELILDGETGRLVPPGDAAALASAILSLLARPDEAEALGARGRDRVRRNYGAQGMIEATVRVYRELLA